MSQNSATTVENASLRLYTYYRSSCSARLRIALALKGLPYTPTFVNLLSNEQQMESYTLINPSQSVPSLEISNGGKTVMLSQSIAALEYLDEAFPSTYQLLPPSSSHGLRASVRTLVAIIASDIQPPTNLRVLNRVRDLAIAAGEDPAKAATSWARDLIKHGLLAYEAACRDVAGICSVGDEVSMADCCLIPAIWGAERFGVDLEDMPRIRRIYEGLGQREEFLKSHWKNQEDTPEALRS